MIEAAQKRGYRYMAITDHTKGLGVAHGLDEARFAEQMRLIDQANRSLRGFTVLKGAEVDIRSDGRLDLDDALSGDGSISSSRPSIPGSSSPGSRSRSASCRRSGIPLCPVIAHPTGRLIGEREAYEVDMEAILREAAQVRRGHGAERLPRAAGPERRESQGGNGARAFRS